MTGSRDEFSKVLQGLVNGDAGVGILPSPDSEIEQKLKKVVDLWQPFEAKVNQLESGARVAQGDVGKLKGDANVG